MAENSRRRHEVVQRFLVLLGVPEGMARNDAEGIEHHCSPETVDAFRRQLERVSGPDSVV